jgi:shikimate dehydrogenase
MTFEISGATRVFGIVADPIAQVQTPQLINALMQQRGFDGVLVPMHVRANDLSSFVASLRLWQNFGGLIVTVPHKTAIIELCDKISDRARAIGAANVVRREPDGRLTADMLDGLGFIEGLRNNQIDLHGRRVYLAGAGGAANAIAFGLAEAGVVHITINNRTVSRADDLRARLAMAFPALSVRLLSDPAGHSLAVNATSLGMRPEDPMPIDVAKLDADAIVAEIIMKPEVTPVLAAARARGLRVHFGKPMLTCQIELMAKFLGTET